MFDEWIVGGEADKWLNNSQIQLATCKAWKFVLIDIYLSKACWLLAAFTFSATKMIFGLGKPKWILRHNTFSSDAVFSGLPCGDSWSQHEESLQLSAGEWFNASLNSIRICTVRICCNNPVKLASNKLLWPMPAHSSGLVFQVAGLFRPTEAK